MSRHPLTIYLTAEQYARVTRGAHHSDMSLSAYVVARLDKGSQSREDAILRLILEQLVKSRAHLELLVSADRRGKEIRQKSTKLAESYMTAAQERLL